MSAAKNPRSFIMGDAGNLKPDILILPNYSAVEKECAPFFFAEYDFSAVISAKTL